MDLGKKKMTDGIIQQVVSKYILMCLSGESGLLPRNSFELRALQQELIEKIKQELTDESKPTFGFWSALVLTKLIGDNQE